MIFGKFFAGVDAQSENGGEPPVPETSLEEIISGTEDESYAARICEDLAYLASNPVDLNTATEEDLARLYYLNDFQIFCILDYRKSYGTLLSLNELNLIPGLREDLIRHILPYVTIGNPAPGPVFSKKKIRPHQNILLRMKTSRPLKEGFREECDSSLKFGGPPFSVLMKYELRAGIHFRTGFTLENDPGEKFSWDKSRKGFDFSSAFLEIRDAGPLSRMVLGDFRYETGSGLVNGSGRRGKSAEVILKQKNAGISRYASAAENGFNRGLAMACSPGKLRFRMMVSSVKTSANTETSGDGEEIFTSLNITGLSRNDAEENSKNNLVQKQLGTGIGYQSDRFSVNYNFLLQSFDKPMRYRILTDRFSQVRDESRFYYHSVDFNYRRKLGLLTCEVATGNYFKPALLTNMIVWLHPLLTLCMNYRYYSPGYFCLNASAFAESDVRNEEGLYAGIETYPFSFLKLSAYIDGYRFPWLKYYGIAPERGRDFFLKAEIKTSMDFKIITLLKYESRHTGAVRNFPGIGSTGLQGDFRYLAEADYEWNENVRLRTKIDYRHSVSPGDPVHYHGIFLCQDLGFHLFENRLTLNARYAFFDSPDWSTRIYAYENDILYSFSTPAFYGKGIRSYLTGRIRIRKRYDLWFKYAVTQYTSPYQSGSGADQREGAVYRDLGVQVVARL